MATKKETAGIDVFSQFPTPFVEAVRADYENHNRVFNHYLNGDYVMVVQHLAETGKDVLLEIRHGNEIPETAVVLDGTFFENSVPLDHPWIQRIEGKGIGSKKPFVNGDPDPAANGQVWSEGTKGFIVPELSRDAEFHPDVDNKPPF